MGLIHVEDTIRVRLYCFNKIALFQAYPIDSYRVQHLQEMQRLICPVSGNNNTHTNIRTHPQRSFMDPVILQTNINYQFLHS